jgi:hypothetical protein
MLVCVLVVRYIVTLSTAPNDSINHYTHTHRFSLLIYISCENLSVSVAFICYQDTIGKSRTTKHVYCLAHHHAFYMQQKPTVSETPSTVGNVIRVETDRTAPTC